jgi:hypothetical protein
MVIYGGNILIEIDTVLLAQANLPSSASIKQVPHFLCFISYEKEEDKFYSAFISKSVCYNSDF